MIAYRKNPPTVFPEASSVADIEGSWWAAHTRSRHEKALAADLIAKEIPYFLPMVEKDTVIRGRKFRVKLPLFPGYLFFAGDDNARYEALTTSHVANVYEAPNQSQIRFELAQIERAVNQGAELDLYPYLKEGRPCRVRRGPLAGLEGIVIKKKGMARIVLQVDFLGQAVATEIDPEIVDPL